MEIGEGKAKRRRVAVLLESSSDVFEGGEVAAVDSEVGLEEYRACSRFEEELR